jgi:hypothetical protein
MVAGLVAAAVEPTAGPLRSPQAQDSGFILNKTTTSPGRQTPPPPHVRLVLDSETAAGRRSVLKEGGT